MFCAQIQLLKVNFIIAFKREGACFPLQSQPSPCRVGVSLNNFRKVCLGGPGYLQTITMTFMVGTKFEKWGRHFQLRASAQPEDRPSAFPGLSSGWPILTETTIEKDLLG